MQIGIPGLRMLLPLAVLLLLVLPGHTQDTTTEKPAVLLPLPKGVCNGLMAGIPGYPGHNGIPGRDGRDGAPGAKGEKGDAGKKFLVSSIRFLGKGALLELYKGIVID